MYDQQSLERALKYVHAVQIGMTANTHKKFRLPNGSQFRYSLSPSDVNSHLAAMKTLVRELRHTHPELKEMFLCSATKPKHKRTSPGSIGVALSLKGVTLIETVNGSVAVPEMLPFTIPSKFQTFAHQTPRIIEEPATTAPEPEEESHRPYYKAPRIPHERKAPPTPARTITAEQLAEANRIYLTEGKAAMDAFFDQCREDGGMVPVTNEIIVERFTPTSHREENEMSHVYDRTIKELEAVNLRIASHDARIAELIQITAQRETDLIKKTMLEGYIEKHKALASEAANLLQEVLPQETAQPIALVKGMKMTRRSSNPDIVQLGFNIVDIRNKVFPMLHAKSETFTIDDVMLAITDCNFPGPPPDRKRMMTWISPMCSNVKSEIRSITKGVYGFKVPFEAARKTG